MIPQLNKTYYGDTKDILKTWPDTFVQTCITSPPYWGLRDYGKLNQIGQEKTPEEYIDRLVSIFDEVKRVLKDDGTIWINIGDTHIRRPQNSNTGEKHAGFQKGLTCEVSRDKRSIPPGYKIKDLVGIPWMLAFALRNKGWYLRCDIIWERPNFTPENVPDRPTISHEYIFLLSKSHKYYYDIDAIMEPSVIDGKRRRKRSVWTIPTLPYKGAHCATFPPKLIEPCVLAGSKQNDVVLDPFMGSGTTAQVCQSNKRLWLGCELNIENEIQLRERLIV